MDAHITQRLFHRRNRVVVGVGLLMAAGVATATTDPATQRFLMHATISPAPNAQSDTRFGLSAQVSPTQKGIVTGAGYTLNASASASPLVCTDDTIFMDGFDPLSPGVR